MDQSTRSQAVARIPYRPTACLTSASIGCTIQRLVLLDSIAIAAVFEILGPNRIRVMTLTFQVHVIVHHSIRHLPFPIDDHLEPSVYDHDDRAK